MGGRSFGPRCRYFWSMQRILINSIPEALDHARHRALPAKAQAELNSVLRELRRLLDLDSRRPVPPITLPRLMRARAR